MLNAYQMAAMFAGGISVYYGDELLLSGGFDPDNRRCMPWNKAGEEPFSLELYDRIHQPGDCRIKEVHPIGEDQLEVRFQGGRSSICMSR